MLRTKKTSMDISADQREMDRRLNSALQHYDNYQAELEAARNCLLQLQETGIQRKVNLIDRVIRAGHLDCLSVNTRKLYKKLAYQLEDQS